jgi:hypothetical protein
MYTEKVGGAMGHRMGSLTLSVGVGNDAFLKPNSQPCLMSWARPTQPCKPIVISRL